MPDSGDSILFLLIRSLVINKKIFWPFNLFVLPDVSYILMTSPFFTEAGFGQPCAETIQCQILLGQDAECDRTCRCTESAHRFKDGRCYKSLCK